MNRFLVQWLGGAELTQTLAKLQTLRRVFTQQQRVLQIETLALRAFQLLINLGAGQVVVQAGGAQLQHPFGIFQRGEVITGHLMQLPQVARQALQHACRVTGVQVAGAQFGGRSHMPLLQLAAFAGVQTAAAAGVEQMVGSRYTQEEMPGEVHPLQRNLQPLRQLQRQQGQ